MNKSLLADALTAVTKANTEVFLKAGMDVVQLMKVREQKLGNLTLEIATEAARRMHNFTPDEIADYVEQRFREAGFNITVKSAPEAQK